MDMEDRSALTDRWLERIDTTVKEGFARIDQKLDQKADKSDLELFASHVTELRGRVRVLEDRRLETETWNKAISEHRQNIAEKSNTERDETKTNIALIGSVLTLFGVIAEYIHSLLTNSIH